MSIINIKSNTDITMPCMNMHISELCWNKFPLQRNRLSQKHFFIDQLLSAFYAYSIWLNYVIFFRSNGELENHNLADGVDAKFVRNNQPPIFVQLTMQLCVLFWFQWWCNCRFRTRNNRIWKHIIGIILIFSINRPCKAICNYIVNWGSGDNDFITSKWLIIKTDSERCIVLLIHLAV